MFKLLTVILLPLMTMHGSDLPSRKYLNLAAIKTMVAASEAKAQEMNVQVTICIVDESGNLLFLEKEDGASLNTLQFAQKKARHAAAYGAPSRTATWKTWHFPIFSPTRVACPFAWTVSSSAALQPAAPSLRSTNRLRKQGSMPC
jgi:hypothetical protein